MATHDNQVAGMLFRIFDFAFYDVAIAEHHLPGLVTAGWTSWELLTAESTPGNTPAFNQSDGEKGPFRPMKRSAPGSPETIGAGLLNGAIVTVFGQLT